MIQYIYFIDSHNNMKQDSQIQFQKYELYSHYFDKCSELALIQKPFSIAEIENEIQRRDLESQFELIRALTETKRHKLKLRVNTILENKKNRYPEQSIYQHSRVRLNTVQNQGYINANWIPLGEGRRLIITQGPLEQTQHQFEQMIAQNQIECVVMLCNIIENGKVRCFDYTADRQKDQQQQNQSTSVCRVYLPHGEYIHIHYSEWPDKSVPEDKQQVRQILEMLMEYKRVVIHCSAGLGRSGVIAALFSLMLRLKTQNHISIFETVLRLREHRFGAIQNNEQYAFIYKYLKFISC